MVTRIDVRRRAAESELRNAHRMAVTLIVRILFLVDGADEKLFRIHETAEEEFAQILALAEKEGGKKLRTKKRYIERQMHSILAIKEKSAKLNSGLNTLGIENWDLIVSLTRVALKKGERAMKTLTDAAVKEAKKFGAIECNTLATLIVATFLYKTVDVFIEHTQADVAALGIRSKTIDDIARWGVHEAASKIERVVNSLLEPYRSSGAIIDYEKLNTLFLRWTDKVIAAEAIDGIIKKALKQL